MPSRPGNNRAASTPVGRPSANAATHALWVLRDGKPVRVVVTVGVSDGTHTAVSGGGLAETDQVITAVRTAA